MVGLIRGCLIKGSRQQIAWLVGALVACGPQSLCWLPGPQSLCWLPGPQSLCWLPGPQSLCCSVRCHVRDGSGQALPVARSHLHLPACHPMPHPNPYPWVNS